MSNDEIIRWVFIIGSLILFSIAAFYRLKSQATGEKLDRRQEGFLSCSRCGPSQRQAYWESSPGW
jgi:hypothetical protein